METPLSLLRFRLEEHLQSIYAGVELGMEYAELADRLITSMRLSDDCVTPTPFSNSWSEKDIVLITYGDSILGKGTRPLQELHGFLNRYLRGIINSVHILPFFPSSSDDGFAVIDYLAVSEDLGSWDDIEAIGQEFHLMADLVVNHCSSQSSWFQNFIAGKEPGCNYFLTASSDDDLSMVVRPRTSDLLRPTPTVSGEQAVWCTFSHDQVDLDFKNPQVLLAFTDIIRRYLDHGVRLFRLDAVAFLWKEPRTPCINLPQTHEIVRLFRCLIEHARGDAVVITETNIPVLENLSYFGEANEANWVYNFPLPPLLLHTLVSGSCRQLRRMVKSMPAPRFGTAFFNFIASHDGIGLRPAEGLLSPEEIDELVKTMALSGGMISWRSAGRDLQIPYEINISLFDALQGTTAGSDDWQIERFICAHAVMLALQGVPGIYIHSLLATPNNVEGVNQTGRNRTINRYRWQADILNSKLSSTKNQHGTVMQRLLALVALRIEQPAFHPNGAQEVLDLGEKVFGLWRESLEEDQAIYALSNVSTRPQTVDLRFLNRFSGDNWDDMISGVSLHVVDGSLTLQPYQSIWLTNRA